MKKIRILCDKTFLLDIQEKNYYVDNNNFLEIESSEKVIVKAYPLEQRQNSLPFCFVLETQKNNIVCNCGNVKVYNLKNRCDVFVEQFLIPSQNVVYTNSYIIKNTRHTLVCYDDRIKIYSNSGEYVFACECSSATSDYSNNYLNVMCQSSYGKSYVRFNTQSKKFFKVCGDKIQIEDDTITTQFNSNNSLNHIIIEKYKNDENLTKCSQEIYSKEQMTTCKVQQIIPYKFLEALSQKDFDTAKEYLIDDILNKLSFDNICEYFGDFDKIEVLNLSPIVYTLYNQYCAKDYKFDIQNGKITDIEEV